jgi:hypothetical protein
MLNLFLNQERAQTFQQTGYLLVDFLAEDEVNALTELHASLESGVSMGFIASMFSQHAGYRQTVDSAIKTHFAAALAKLFKPHRCLAGAFLEKRPVPECGEVPLHQDWTFVDETQFQSLNVWCALEDVDEHNGCLWLLPGSHLFPTHLRAPFGPAPWIGAFSSDFTGAMRPMVMKKGQALIFGHAMWHASKLNHGQTSRLAASCSIVPQEAPIFHYCYDRQAQSDASWAFERYQVDEIFFSSYQLGSPIAAAYTPQRIVVEAPVLTAEHRQALVEKVHQALACGK